MLKAIDKINNCELFADRNFATLAAIDEEIYNTFKPIFDKAVLFENTTDVENLNVYLRSITIESNGLFIGLATNLQQTFDLWTKILYYLA